MPVKHVKEIVYYVGQWEKIVDVPVTLRRLDFDGGFQILHVLEQIVDVLKVCFHSRSPVNSGCGMPVPPATEEIIEERIAERSAEQTIDWSVPQVVESVEVQVSGCVVE